jgi:hypothetical protein
MQIIRSGADHRRSVIGGSARVGPEQDRSQKVTLSVGGHAACRIWATREFRVHWA